jgi:hypothetical protein
VKGSFCNPRDCFNYDEPSSRVSARARAFKGARRGDAINHCVERRKKYRSKKVCFVEGKKQPTNTTLVLATAAAVSVAWAAGVYK